MERNLIPLFFGVARPKSNARYIIIDMVLRSVINLDGLIDLSKLKDTKKKFLFKYLLYLQETNELINIDGDVISEHVLELEKHINTKNFVLKRDLAEYINDYIIKNNLNITIINQFLDKMYSKLQKADLEISKKIKIDDNFL